MWVWTQPTCIARDKEEGGVVRFLLHELNKHKGQRVIYGVLLPCRLPSDSLTFGVD